MRFDVPEDLRNKSGVYVIRNLVNGHLYVGSAREFARRFRQHLHDLRRVKHRNAILQAAFNKHGENNFAFTVLEVVSDMNQLVKVEQTYLDRHFDGRVACYNISPTASSSLGVTRSKSFVENHKRLLAEFYKTRPGFRLGTKQTPEARKRLSASHIGLTNHTIAHTEDTKRRISAAKIGHPCKRTRYDVTLVAPNGIAHEHVTDVKNFARSHQLNQDGLYGLLKGKYATYRGWTAR